jgi:hypothetical protein
MDSSDLAQVNNLVNESHSWSVETIKVEVLDDIGDLDRTKEVNLINYIGKLGPGSRGDARGK